MPTFKAVITAATITISVDSPAAAFEIVGSSESSSVQLIEIAQELDNWLDANSPYPRAELPLGKIAFVTSCSPGVSFAQTTLPSRRNQRPSIVHRG